MKTETITITLDELLEVEEPRSDLLDEIAEETEAHTQVGACTEVEYYCSDCGRVGGRMCLLAVRKKGGSS